jgi:hypothetical protein
MRFQKIRSRHAAPDLPDHGPLRRIRVEIALLFF